MKNRILVGLTGTPDSRKYDCIRLIADSLGLRHYNMRAPIIKAAAAILNVSEDFLEDAESETKIENLGITDRELLDRLATTLRLCNRDFLISVLKIRMQAYRGDFLHSGWLISSITTEHEASWLRKQGGILIHLHNSKKFTSFTKLLDIQNDDQLLTYCRDNGPSELSLRAIIENLRFRFQDQAA